MGGTPLESLEVFEDFESDFLILVLTSVARVDREGCRPYFVCDHAHSFHYVEANTCLYHTDLNLTSESPRVSRRSSDTIIEVVGCPPFERKRVLNTNGKEARVL